MNLGEILDRTLDIYRSNFLLFAGIAVIPAIATMGVELASYLLWGSYPPYTLNLVFGITVAELGSMLGFYHFSIFFQFLIWPSFAYATSLSYIAEKPAMPLHSVLRASIDRWRGWLALSGVLILWTLVLPEIVTAGMFLGITYLLSVVANNDSATMDAVLPPVLILSCIAGWVAIGWMSATVSLAIPSRTLETLSVRTAIRRGRKLSKGSRFRLLVVWLMPAILGWILTLTVSRALFFLRSSCSLYDSDILIRIRVFATLIPWHGWCVSSSVVEVIRILSEAAILTLLGPIFPIALTLFYYDQRIRLEGYDIERMMDAAGLIAPIQTAPVIPPEETELVTPAAIEEAHS
jgi:hypothetical protein